MLEFLVIMWFINLISFILYIVMSPKKKEGAK